VALQISGPKGVGKSTSLCAFALQLMISNITRKDTTILYLTEKSSDCQFTNRCLQCNNLCCTFSELAYTSRYLNRESLYYV